MCLSELSEVHRDNPGAGARAEALIRALLPSWFPSAGPSVRRLQCATARTVAQGDPTGRRFFPQRLKNDAWDDGGGVMRC